MAEERWKQFWTEDAVHSKAQVEWRKKNEIWYVGCCCSQVANVDRKINGTNDFDDDENKTEREKILPESRINRCSLTFTKKSNTLVKLLIRLCDWLFLRGHFTHNRLHLHWFLIEIQIDWATSIWFYSKIIWQKLRISRRSLKLKSR